MADEQSERETGTLLGLLRAARADLDVAIARLENSEPTTAPPTDPSVHVHSSPLKAAGFGDDPPTYFCGECGERYDPKEAAA